MAGEACPRPAAAGRLRGGLGDLLGRSLDGLRAVVALHVGDLLLLGRDLRLEVGDSRRSRRQLAGSLRERAVAVQTVGLAAEVGEGLLLLALQVAAGTAGLTVFAVSCVFSATVEATSVACCLISSRTPSVPPTGSRLPRIGDAMRPRDIHHIGHAVDDIAAAVDMYERLFAGVVEHHETVPEQGVEAASLRVGTDCVELLGRSARTRRWAGSWRAGDRECTMLPSR